ncbi:MAG TPA: hypothetical protein VGX76_24490, partial [Pirellulales bacterium]|nr:hypothetical protein [Pirellulales bacterium]
ELAPAAVAAPPIALIVPPAGAASYISTFARETRPENGSAIRNPQSAIPLRPPAPGPVKMPPAAEARPIKSAITNPQFRRQSAIRNPQSAIHEWRWQLNIGSWLISLVFHALLVIVLGLVFKGCVRGTGASAPGELAATFSTVIGDGDYYDDEGGSPFTLAGGGDDDNPLNLAQASGGAGSNDAAAGSIVGDESPVDISGALPSRAETSGPGPGGIGPGGVGKGELGDGPGAGKFAGGGGGGGGRRGPAKVSGGKGSTKVYGVQGDGNSFVYVFDHSASMGGGPNSPLAWAKSELLGSLADLGDTQQFQIIFYNEKPTRMNVGRSYGGMVLADPETKRQAERFVRSIVADGGTRHESAIEMALKLAPDVIFFLTDADEPQLSPAQLARIKKANGERSVIHTIEFGDGRGGTRDNFLKEIARQNGGRYVYIDITKRRERK